MSRLRGAALLAAVIATPLPAAAATAEPVTLHALGPKGNLEGTLLSPSATGAPVALIIPGSGPTDRDGNNPLGIKAAPYRLLAEGLAELGIATVRIDKRGLFGSRGAVSDPEAVTIADYATDVAAWARVIRERTGNGCVWLIGHSEGGLVALAAAQDAAGLCGVILLAAPGRPFGDLLREQLRANPANAPLLAQALAAIDSLEAGKRVDVAGMPPPLALLFRPSIQGFMIDLAAHDPAKLIASVRLPLLIVQGERDIQIGVGDAQRLAKANPAAKLVLMPKANHVLKDVPADDREANLRSYAMPDLPLAEGLVEAVASFIKASPPQPRRD
jgi:pimeloyl-ACP methyl ester carboxylesterase